MGEITTIGLDIANVFQLHGVDADRLAQIATTRADAALLRDACPLPDWLGSLRDSRDFAPAVASIVVVFPSSCVALGIYRDPGVWIGLPSVADPAAVRDLLRAAHQGSDLIYVGSVGTGFTNATATDLKRTLDRLKTKTPPVPVKGKNIVFSQPTLIVEIEYRAWAADGKLRHPSYKGVREVQDNAAIQIKDH
jgi:hypothetical protein